jgi:DNA (cytosine-5)-methyltransferase 1
MRYLSVCSGIEAASVAWGPLGWRAAAFSEIEPFPCAVLAHHYPDVPNLGDMTTIAQRVLNGEVEAPDVLAGGTPCQSFSIAGLRKSLADERGNLTLKFVEIADAIDSVRVRDGHPPAIVVWENVHGVLSTKDNAFGCFLAGLAGEDEPLQPPGGKWANAGAVYGPARAIAWRVLDAQYFGLAQQRRRVFVVASAREGFDPAKVLFEFDGVRRDTAPSREERQTAPTIPARSTGGGGLGTDFDYDGGLIHVDPIARCVTAGEAKRQDGETCNFIAFHPTQDPISSTDGSTHALGCGSTGGQASVAVAVAQPVVYAIQAGALRVNPASGPDGVGVQADHAYTLEARAEVQAVQHAMQVRRLMPRECERLMGSPDDYTLVPLPLKGRQTRVRWASDSARYKALGNSWAVPVVRWIGERINAAVEHIKHERKAQ